MDRVFDVAFAISMYYFFSLVTFYVAAMALTYDDGRYYKQATQATLDLIGSRTEHEYQSLSDPQRITIQETVARLERRLRTIDPDSRRSNILVSLLISDANTKKHSTSLARIDEQREHLFLQAVKQLEITTGVADGEEVQRAVSHLETSTWRELRKMWWLGVKENYAAVLKGAQRRPELSYFATIASLVIVALAKITLRDSISIAGDFVALIGLLGVVAGVALSPTIVLIRAMREISASQSSDDPAMRRKTLRSLVAVAVLLCLVWIAAYAGPVQFDGLPDTVLSLGSPLARVSLVLFAAFLAYFVLWPVLLSVKVALSGATVHPPNPSRRSKGVSVWASESGFPLTMPFSARLRTLGAAVLFLPIIGGLVGACIFFALAPAQDYPIDARGGDKVVWVAVTSLIWLVLWGCAHLFVYCFLRRGATSAT